MSQLADIANFLSHLGDAFDNLTQGLQRSLNRSFQTFDYISARRAKKQLLKLHKLGSELGLMQHGFWDGRMSWYINEPTPEHWDEAKKDIQKVIDGLPDIASEAAKIDSAFVLEPMYKEYLIAI